MIYINHWKYKSKDACPNSIADCLLSRGGSQNLSSDAKMFIISYHLMAGANKEKFQLRPDGKPHRMIIADESHCIKDKPVPQREKGSKKQGVKRVGHLSSRIRLLLSTCKNVNVKIQAEFFSRTGRPCAPRPWCHYCRRLPEQSSFPELQRASWRTWKSPHLSWDSWVMGLWLWAFDAPQRQQQQ